MKLSIGYLPKSDLAEKLLEHFLIPGTVPSLPLDSDSAQTLGFEIRLVCKFRLSDHSLAIETARYKKIPQHLQTCNKCETLDDKNHFFLNYSKSD
jgi:hypothetical protein